MKLHQIRKLLFLNIDNTRLGRILSKISVLLGEHVYLASDPTGPYAYD
jgi:hypothetical protein